MIKLFTKYNRINLSVMAIVFIISGGIYYLLIKSVLIDELDEALQKYERRIEKYVTQYGSLPVFKNLEEVEIDYRNGTKLAESTYSLVERFDPEERKPGTYRQLVFSQIVGGKFYRITVAKPVEGTTLLTNVIACSTLIMILLIIIISVILNRFILKKLWKPFYLSLKEMKAFKLGGNDLHRLPETGIEEFSMMNHSISGLISNAKDDYRVLKEFTENASHEIQTPLAIIRAKLDLVIQDEDLSADQSTALKAVYSGIHRLTKLNQSLLLLAKIENKQFGAVQVIDMKGKMEEKIDQFTELWVGHGISWTTDLKQANMKANAELIDILFNNLFSNASRHNVEGGVINILLSGHTLSISNSARYGSLDTGKVFNRFYKENQASQNNGLGLAIVQQIAGHSGITISYNFADRLHIFSLSW